VIPDGSRIYLLDLQSEIGPVPIDGSSDFVSATSRQRGIRTNGQR
jgi:hypothetical protein